MKNEPVLVKVSGEERCVTTLKTAVWQTSERNERVKYFFQHEKRNFVSPSGYVMFYLLYKRQRNTKPFRFNSFLVWKERFIM